MQRALVITFNKENETLSTCSISLVVFTTRYDIIKIRNTRPIFNFEFVTSEFRSHSRFSDTISKSSDTKDYIVAE